MPDNEDQIVRELPIEWVVPDSVLTSRTTNITIQQSGSAEFIVSFFEQRLPTITGSLEEQLEQFKKLEAVTAICTARLVLDYQKLIEFSDVFKVTIDEFQQKAQKRKEISIMMERSLLIASVSFSKTETNVGKMQLGGYGTTANRDDQNAPWDVDGHDNLQKIATEASAISTAFDSTIEKLKTQYEFYEGQDEDIIAVLSRYPFLIGSFQKGGVAEAWKGGGSAGCMQKETEGSLTMRGVFG